MFICLSDYEHYSNLHQRGELTKEDDAAMYIASVAMTVPKELSGEFIRINEERAQTLINAYKQAVYSITGPNI
jgi:hypothetical protein